MTKNNEVRNADNYNGFTKFVVDDITEKNGALVGSGLVAEELYLTLETFALHPTSLNISFGDWFNKNAFNKGGFPLGIFRKFYVLLGGEFTGFQAAQSATLNAFLSFARTLCGATETAEFRYAVIHPVTWKIDFLFYENGVPYRFERDSEAYLSVVGNNEFEDFKNAMYQIASGIAVSKEPDFWN